MDDFLEGKSSEAIDLFNTFISEYRKIGTFQLHPVKTRAALLTLMRFCSINKIGKDFIDVHFVLTKEYKSRCFNRIDNLANRFFVHHVRLRGASDITPEVRKYMKLAYDTGNRKHVSP